MDSGDPINDVVGKCDRHNKCCYELKPWRDFEEHPEELPKKSNHRHPKPEPPKPLVTIPFEYVEKSLVATIPDHCDFIDFLLRIFEREDVERVIQAYHLGTTKTKSVIFWQIDENGDVHEGKAMAYNPANGRRDKASWATGASKWVFSTMHERGLLPTDASSTKILFGQHLLAKVNEESNILFLDLKHN